MSEEIRGINNLLNWIDIESIGEIDPYFKQILNSLVKYFEDWWIRWIRFFWNEKKSWFVVSYKSQDWTTTETKRCITQKTINKLLESWLSFEDVILKLKLEILKECFNLRFSSILWEQSQEQIIVNLLSPYWWILWITLEPWNQFHWIHTVAIRIKDKENVNTAIKVNHFEDLNDLWRSLEVWLKRAVTILCEKKWIELKEDWISILVSKTLEHYKIDYNELRKRLESLSRQAA